MIKALSAVVSDWLLKEGVVEDSDRGLFEYAAYSFIFGLAPVMIIIILGSIFGLLYEGLLMIIPFMLIRKFSGGYHLESPVVCVVTSTAILVGALLLISYVISTAETYILSSVSVAACLCIFFCSPVDSEARRLSDKEKVVFRRIARAMALTAIAVYFTLCSLGQVRSAVPIAVGIVVAAALQLPCIFLTAINNRRKSV